MALLVQEAPTPVSGVGATAGTVPVTQTASTPVSATAAINTAVVVTIAAVAGQSVRLTALSVSYNSAPTAGALTVVVNAVTIMQLDITATGPTVIPLPDGGLECAAGFSCVITLAAAGAAVTGKVNAASYYGA